MVKFTWRAGRAMRTSWRRDRVFDDVPKSVSASPAIALDGPAPPAVQPSAPVTAPLSPDMIGRLVVSGYGQ